MKRVATVQIYDRYDDVVVVARVREYRTGDKGKGALVLHHATSLKSTGVDRPADWLQRALVHFLAQL